MRLPFNGDFRLSQGFGQNPDMYKKYNLLGHNGLDYALPTGTPVVAPHKGVVKEAVFDPLGYGWYIKIESDTEGSTLAHLLEGSFSVKVGDHVDEGQRLASSNNSGFSTGPHLHWGYYTLPRNRQNGYSGYIDQEPLLKPTNIPENSSNQPPILDEDLLRGSQVLLDYRKQRELGPEGSFEGYARAIVENDKRYKQMATDLFNAQQKIRENQENTFTQAESLSIGQLFSLIFKKLPFVKTNDGETTETTT